MSFEAGVLVLFGIFVVFASLAVAVVVAIVKALFRGLVRGTVRETHRALNHPSMRSFTAR